MTAQRRLLPPWSVQLAVVTSPGESLAADVLDLLLQSRARGVIRLVDAATLSKGNDGEIAVRPVPGLELDDSSLAGTLAATLFVSEPQRPSAGCRAVLNQTTRRARANRHTPGLSADDLAEIVDAMPPVSTAIVLLIEHRWITGFEESLADAQGVLLASGWVTPATLWAICGGDDPGALESVGN